MDWRALLRSNITDLDTLVQFLELDEKNAEALLSRPRFPLNLPLRLAKKIEKNNLTDPIFRQFVPLQEETKKRKNFFDDPVQDIRFRKGKKLLQKYQGRALLVASGACAMNCRFCFRQNFPYETEEKGFAKELEEIRKDETLSEIILSGGDPLSLPNAALSRLFADLSLIPHIKIVRFHTRFPLGIPERIDEKFLKILETCRFQIVFIIHSNHAKELDEEVLSALKSIQKLGIPLLCHTVLLQGVNDSFEVLKELFLKLIVNGILPYYLNQLDPVQGTSHFQVSLKKGKKLIAALRKELPGYAIPMYAQEIPGDFHKTPIL